MEPRNASHSGANVRFITLLAMIALLLLPLASGANTDSFFDLHADDSAVHAQATYIGAEKSIKRSDCTTSSPGSHYVCVGSTWTYFDTVLGSGSILPLSSEAQTMKGSLYMASGANITLSSLSSRLFVEDCANLAATAVVSLSLSDTETIRKDSHKSGGTTYLLVESTCDTSAGMKATIISSPRECYEYSVAVRSAPTTAGRFAVLLHYTVHSVRCHYWWITLLCIVFITPAVLLLMLGAKLLLCSKQTKTKPPRRTVTVAVD